MFKLEEYLSRPRTFKGPLADHYHILMTIATDECVVEKVIEDGDD